MASDPEALAALLISLSDTRAVLCGTVAATAFMVYDTALELGEEVEYVWKSRWSIAKAAYLFGRYYGLVYTALSFFVNSSTGLSMQFCHRWTWYFTMGGFVLFPTIVNIILIMRINAMYQSRRVLIFLCLLVVVEVSLELYGSAKAAMNIVQTSTLAPPGIPYPGCLSHPRVSFTLISWIPNLIVSAVFFFMMLWKTLKTQGLRRLGVPFIQVFVRDGVVFFLLIFSTILVNTISTAILTRPVLGFFTPWIVPVYSYSCSRLVLNLREAADRGRSKAGSSNNSMVLYPTSFSRPPHLNASEY